MVHDREKQDPVIFRALARELLINVQHVEGIASFDAELIADPERVWR